MRVADAGGLIPGQWGSEGADASTAVQNGESTLTQVASRLGIPLEDLVNANPQIANPNGLTAGMEVRIPLSAQGGRAAGSVESDAPDPNIATSKRIPLETVTIDSDFQQLNIDSMDAVEILFAMENEFDISIPDDEVRNVRNVRQMCEGVEKLLAAKNAAATQ